MTRFDDALQALPPPGLGHNCHTALLGAANHGAYSNVPADQMFCAMRARVDAIGGGRAVPDREIRQAIDKALADRNDRPRYRLRPRANQDALRKIIAAGQDATIDDLRVASPVPITWASEDDAAHVLEALYGSDEMLFTGGPYCAGKEHIRSMSEWLWDFLGDAPVPPHIIPNPLTGEQGKTKDGKPSFRADSCVDSFRFVVVEHDALTLADQIRFWAAAKLPVAALIHSGGKSIHAWVRVDCRDAEEWIQKVERTLYDHYLTPMGFDPACRNEARLSRLPGHLRGRGRWQRILYLAPEGKAVTS